MTNYENLLEALRALTPAEAMTVSYLLSQDQTVPELILSLKIEMLKKKDAANAN